MPQFSGAAAARKQRDGTQHRATARFGGSACLWRRQTGEAVGNPQRPWHSAASASAWQETKRKHPRAALQRHEPAY
jgi:hypothetical protein